MELWLITGLLKQKLEPMAKESFPSHLLQGTREDSFGGQGEVGRVQV